MAVVDWVIVAGYLVLTLALGIFFARRAGRSTTEFFLSGRSLPWWLAGTSMVATSFASDTPLVVTGWVRRSGISFNWIWWSFAIGGMFSVFLLSRLWRRAEVITDVELTELRYSGKSAAALRAFRGAYMGVIVNCITLAWVIVAMVKLAGTLAPLPPAWVKGIGGVLEPIGLGWVDPQKFLAVAVCIVLTAVYSVLSGLWGVVVTDLFQFVLAMGGAILLCVLAVRGVGGPAELARGAAESSALGERLLEFFPRLPEKGHWFGTQFWSGPFLAFCVFLSMQWWANKNADGGGVVVQRMLSARDERHALLGTLWFNIANYALRPWPWILVALASVIVFPDVDGESAYPAMMKRFLPAGLMGVMVASFLGAFMSTIDTHLNLSSAYIVNDVYRRFVRKHAPERHYVLVSRIASVGFVILGSAIALISDSISGPGPSLVLVADQRLVGDLGHGRLGRHLQPAVRAQVVPAAAAAGMAVRAGGPGPHRGRLDRGVVGGDVPDPAGLGRETGRLLPQGSTVRRVGPHRRGKRRPPAVGPGVDDPQLAGRVGHGAGRHPGPRQAPAGVPSGGRGVRGRSRRRGRAGVSGAGPGRRAEG